jgi:hypothetical protein
MHEDDENRDVVAEQHHFMMSQTGDQVSQNSLHRGESEDNDEVLLSQKRQ